MVSRSRPPRPAVIFCRSRSATEAIAALLRPHVSPGRAPYYHAGLSREKKRATEQRFFERGTDGSSGPAE